jgi:hypothetical protein
MPLLNSSEVLEVVDSALSRFVRCPLCSGGNGSITL